MFRKKSVMCLTAAACAVSFSGCANMNRTQKGAAAGAAAGGLVGAASKGGRGAAIGAAAGALAGGALGAYLDSRQKELAQVVQTQKTGDGLKITLRNDLLFDFNQTEIKPTASSDLQELSRILAKYPKDRLRIEGFTDHIGAEAYNRRLSQERAVAVEKFLSGNGVKNEMSAVGRGEIPGTGSDPAAVAANRKVEIYIDVAAPESAKN